MFILQMLIKFYMNVKNEKNKNMYFYSYLLLVFAFIIKVSSDKLVFKMIMF